jgi:hypothetical protein
MNTLVFKPKKFTIYKSEVSRLQGIANQFRIGILSDEVAYRVWEAYSFNFSSGSMRMDDISDNGLAFIIRQYTE